MAYLMQSRTAEKLVNGLSILAILFSPIVSAHSGETGPTVLHILTSPDHLLILLCAGLLIAFHRHKTVMKLSGRLTAVMAGITNSRACSKFPSAKGNK